MRYYKTVFMLICLFVISLSPVIQAASTYRQAIEVNSTIALTDFQVLIIIDTASLVTAGQMKADGGDIRFTDSDGTTPLPFWIENVSTYVNGASSVTSMNTTATRIWVRIPNIPINPPDPSKLIHMFYGDPTATSVADGSATFIFFDDFSSGLGKWTIHKQPNTGDISIVDGYLNCGGGFAGGTYGHTVIGTVNSYNSFTDGVIECLIWMTSNSIAEISYRGNVPNNTGYKVRWDQRPGTGMGFLKPPYVDKKWKFWNNVGEPNPAGQDLTGFTTGYWFPAKIEVSGYNVKIYQAATVFSCADGGVWSPPAPSTPVVNLYPGPGEISLQNHYGIWCRYDDVRVRSIASVEPTIKLLGQGNLTITRIDASQSTVNRGQNGVPVSMQIDNSSDESVSFLGASLVFSLGNYNQTLSAPSPGTIIPPHSRITASFSVDILTDSALGDATIDGTVVINGLVDLAGSAALKGNWTIQNPPDLIIDQIIASDTAYRGDVNRPVLVTVRNAGEGTAYWASSTLQFTLGDYTSITPQTIFPIKLLGGTSATAIYEVDISPTSPTGTSTIDVSIAGSDGNTLYPILISGALLPDEWNIPAEYVRTYSNTECFNHLQEFTLPKIGSTTVYAQAKNLAPLTEFVVRWLNNSGTQVAFTNPSVTSNSLGTLADKYSLVSSSPTGNWTVRITNPLNTKTFCESNFQVTSGASLSILLLLPQTVSVGQNFSSTMTFINSGDTDLIDARPGTIATSGVGIAELISGPTPSLQDVPAHSMATFTWTWEAQAAGTFIFSGMGYGWDSNSLERHTAPTQPGMDGGSGLRADYYNNTSFTGSPLVQLDQDINFNWAYGTPDSSIGENYFSVRWTGWVTPEYTENYTFFSSTDDGVRLWVNGVLLIDKWINQGTTEWSGSIMLNAGEKYSITMEYYENTGGAVAQLRWESTSTAKDIIPSSQLYPASLIDVLQNADVTVDSEESGFLGYYYPQNNFTGDPLLRIDPTIDFDWGGGEPDSTTGAENFTVRWRAWVIPEFTDTYTFFTKTDDGVQLWVDDNLLINKWVAQSAKTWSGSIDLIAGQKYPLTMEYVEYSGDAVAQLSWKTPSTSQEIIPQSRAIPRSYCTIQASPDVSVVSVIATPTTVFLNQSDIEIEVVIQNSGEGAAMIEAASLTFTLGNLTQTILTPTFPQELPGNNATITVKFNVDVDLLSPTGLSDFSCNVLSRDISAANALTWLNLPAPSDSWTISENGLTISAFPAYSPAQNTFSRGQTLYASGFYQTPSQQGKIRFYDSHVSYTTPAPAGAISVSGLLTANTTGNLLTTYNLLPTATLGDWTALVEDNTGTVLGATYFSVKSAGNLVASLTLSPATVNMGATFTAELSVKNDISDASTIFPAIPWPLLPTKDSTGKAILVSGPTPAQGSISSNFPATFTWVFQAIEDTGDIGSYSLTASFTTDITYRTPISISSDKSLTNHQIRLTIDTATLVGAGKIRSDCADIRFRDSDSQTTLPHWIESGANTATTIIWVKVPTITANIPKIIYCYYGNPTAIDSSNGNAVFEFFDHFTTFNSAIWDRAGTNSVSGTNLNVETGAIISHAAVSSQDGMAVEASISWSNFSGYSGLAISSDRNDKINNLDSHKLINLMTNNSNSASVRARAANGTTTSYNITNGTTQFTAVANTNYIIGFAILDGYIQILRDHSISNSYAGTWSGPFYLWLGYITGSQAGGTNISDLQADWVLVRKFANPEPTVSIGVEESPPQYPLISGIDISTGMATDSNSGISNSIRILRQNVELSSDVIDLGSIPCGETGSEGNTTASNTGNADLTMVRWDLKNLESLEGIIIDKTNLTFSPDPVGPIALGGKIPASLTISIPLGQATGTYIATMSVYDDINGNLWRDLGATGEPVDAFQVRVVVPESKKIEVVEEFIDLGNWEIGMTTDAKPTQAFNAGNVSLSNLTFKQIIGTNSFDIDISTGTLVLATDTFLFSNVIATITVGPSGYYIATWTLWSDANANNIIDTGEASDSFQVKVGVGLSSMDLLPTAIDFGICSPAVIIEAVADLKNTGQVEFNNLQTVLYDLQDGAGNSIASDQILLDLPAVVAATDSLVATVSLYIPSGTHAGDYSGIQLVYEDRNGNGLPDLDEASATLTITVTVPVVRKVEVYSDFVDMGSIIPGTSKILTLDCRNIGNTDLSELRWMKTDLLDGVKLFDLNNASFPTSQPFPVAAGEFFSRDFKLTVPIAQAPGSYFSISPHYWLFNDDDHDNLLSVDEPGDAFTAYCKVGWWDIDILETSLNITGDPSLISPTTSFHVENTGDLSVINAKTTVSALSPVVAGPPDISALASIITPVVIGEISSQQIKGCTWQVSIPNCCIAGDYIGTLTIWDDRNNNDLLDADEVSDTVDLVLTVNSKRVIKIMQNPMNLGWTLSGTTVEGVFEVVNVGNVDLTKVTPLASDILNMGNTIPATSISFNPSTLDNMTVGTAKFATLTLIVGWPRADGTYSGNQRVFEDNSPADGLFSANEESTLFNLMVSVGNKKLSITNPVDFGNREPRQIVTQSCSIKNEATVPLTNIKWLKGELVSGVNTIPVASLSFIPIGPIGLGGSNSRGCVANIAIDATVPPGNYTGTHSVWEDNNGDGIIQSSEASATFNTNLTVTALPALDILSGTIDGGQIAAGLTSPWIEVLFENTGNVPLTSAELLWNFSNMSDSDGNSFAATNITASTTILPDPLPIKQTGKAFFQFGPIPGGQTPGLYFGSPQTLTNGGTASDFCEFTCEIINGGPQNLSPDSIIQSIATATFEAPAKRYFFSAFVCPASGSAKISLLGRDEADITTTQIFGMEINSDLTLTTFGAIHNAEIIETIPTSASNLYPWYRIYFSFDYSYDALVASQTYLSLENSSPVTASHTVWFDGIQFERSIFPGQTRPTAYSPHKKIVSPSREQTIQGGNSYYEW